MWDDNSRKNLLSADNFKQLYCNNLTIDRADNNGVHINDLRRVIFRLTELMPHMAHSTPGWTEANANTILIVTGRCASDYSIRPLDSVPRIGLCGIAGQIYLWTDYDYLQQENNLFQPILVADPNANDAWIEFRKYKIGQDPRYSYRYTHSLNIENELDDNYPLPTNHPLSNGKQIANALHELNHNFIIDPASQRYPNNILNPISPRYISDRRNYNGVNDENENIDTGNKEESNMPISLNSILYGPPGTGKTYNTVSEALKIFNFIDPDYSNLKTQFDNLKSNGLIEFVTFHQSFSYEDFVEGIRAETNDNGELSYSIKDGVFKKIAIEALFSKFEEKFTEQLDELWEEAKSKNRYQNKITADTKYDRNNYDHKKLILSACKIGHYTVGKGEKYVLIIDEINRGNTSRVFGELITLIETTKRAGTDEAMDAILPYSQETFTVPDNLYIIGTMNTADRSLALMDTALRRRFDFIEMMPKPELIVNDSNNPLEIEGIKVQEMLQTINDRIEALYDREHTIGHAFFMKLKDEPTIETLASIFRNNILPLLEEYFFEDWDKIINVLGKTEIYKENPNLTETKLGFKPSNKSYSRNANALTKPETYISIYDSVSNNNSVQSE